MELHAHAGFSEYCLNTYVPGLGQAWEAGRDEVLTVRMGDRLVLLQTWGWEAAPGHLSHRGVASQLPACLWASVPLSGMMTG